MLKIYSPKSGLCLVLLLSIIFHSSSAVPQSGQILEDKLDSRSGEEITRFQTGKDFIKYYVFGHSLFTWDTQTQQGSTAESSTGYWLGSLAQQNAKQSGGIGQWGQLSYHTIPPKAQYLYSTDSIPPWTKANGAWADQDYSHVIIMPSNFEQNWVTPDKYMEQTARVVDYVQEQEPSADLILYEHWPKPDQSGSVANGANLTDAERQVYRAYTSGAYHDWFVRWQNLIVEAYPTLNVRMIPVGPVIADLIEAAPYLEDVQFTDLYVDQAPHGTRTTYFLAALVMYRAMYLESPDASYVAPTGLIHDAVTDNLSSIISFIDRRLQLYNERGVRVFNN